MIFNIFQSTPSVWRETGNKDALIDRLVFQSTPSVWRETGNKDALIDRLVFQSTPSVWRETFTKRANCFVAVISIHSLRVEGDSSKSCILQLKFISIHSLRVEGDIWQRSCYHRDKNFNPLPPCGGRREIKKARTSSFWFQSTPSVWRETPTIRCLCKEAVISIHSLRVEGDYCYTRNYPITVYFNPLPPCGGRPCIRWDCRCYSHFNPLPPCGGRRILFS